jgi:hypothetical protein
MPKCVLALALGLIGGVLVGKANRMGANHRRHVVHCRWHNADDPVDKERGGKR